MNHLNFESFSSTNRNNSDLKIQARAIDNAATIRALFFCCAKIMCFLSGLFFSRSFLCASTSDFKINPQSCSKEIAIYCRDLLKIKYNKGHFLEQHSFNNAGAIPGHTENTNYTLWEKRARGQTLLTFFPYPSHIYFIRCILHRLHGGRMAMRSDTHSHTHTCTNTHATGPQMSTGACSDSVFSPLGVFSFFQSSREDNKHQQPDIISIGEDKE